MRGDITLDDRPAVALWMSKVREVDPQFSVMVRRMNIDKASKRDFLKPGSDDTSCHQKGQEFMQKKLYRSLP